MTPLFPFLLELPADAWLIKAGKKDLSWKVRTIKLRGKKWYYLSTTNGKFWDRQFAKLNPRFLLVLRGIGFGLLMFGWIKF